MAEDKSFYDQLSAIMTMEAHNCTADVKKKARKHANKLKNKISADSPSKTGKYKKGWEAAVEYESEFGISVVVKQKDRSKGGKPTLPHLLENSHIIIVRNKNGSYRMTGDKTKPVPHIKNNAETEINAFYEDCKKEG